MPDTPTPLDLDAIRATYGKRFESMSNSLYRIVGLLVAEVEHLRAQNAYLRREGDRLSEGNARLLAEVARLEEDLSDRTMDLAEATHPDLPAPAWDEDAIVLAVFERSHEPSFEDSEEGMREAKRFVRSLATLGDHPPVKPDREAVARALDPGAWRDEPMPERPDSVADEEWGRIWDRVRIESKAPSLVQADAVLDLWPGRSETEVKAEAWAEGANAGYADGVYGRTGLDVTPNPYRLADEGGADRG